MKPYQPRPDRDQRLASVIIAAEAIGALDLYPRPKRELLSICLWKATEIDGKFNSRYCSRGALEAGPEIRLNHDHVIERHKLVDRMLAGEPAADVVRSAVACMMTIDEHGLLTEISRENTGLGVIATVSRLREVELPMQIAARSS